MNNVVVKVSSQKVFNLTPYDVRVEQEARRHITFPASKTPLRVQTDSKPIFELDCGIPVKSIEIKPMPGSLPEKREDTYYIVSGLVRSLHPERKDLLSPDTGPSSAIRDESGAIVAVRGLIGND